MPQIPPPTPSAPYPVLETVLNLARTRLNDAIASIGGEILTDSQPFTATMVNAAWRRLQAYLSNLGYSKYKRKFWAYGIPAVDSTDPSQQTMWTWTQYTNASGVVYAPPVVPVFPADFIAPLVVKQRPTGTNQVFHQFPSAPDGLPEGMKRPWNWAWEWKNDAMYMPGSTYSMDFEIEYAAYDYDFLVTNNVLGDSTQVPPIIPANMAVPIMRSESALANYICAECAQGRTDADTAVFIGEAEKDAKLIMNNSDVKLKQRRPVQRKAYSGRRNTNGQLWGNAGY